DLVYWPSAHPQRARFAERRGEALRLTGAWPGSPTIENFLDQFSQALAVQPWLDQFLAVLQGVMPIPPPDPSWLVRDHQEQALPLCLGDHWKLLALSGGRPLDLAGEWNGDALLPLGVSVAGRYYRLGETV